MVDKDLDTHFLATFLFVFIRYWQRGIIYIGDYSVYALHYKMFYFIILLYKSPLNVSLHKRFVQQSIVGYSKTREYFERYNGNTVMAMFMVFL